MINIDQFSQLINDFVRYYPRGEYKCHQPQTYCLLAELSELNTPHLGQRVIDKDKPYFFSRKWALDNYNTNKISYDYPGVFMFEENSVSNSLFENRKIKKETNLEIAVLDSYDLDCKSEAANYCKKRTKYEIYKDTEDILDNLIFFLRSIRVYMITTAGPINQTLYGQEQLLIKLLADGEINSYSEDVLATKKYNDALVINKSKDNIGMRADAGDTNDYLYGTTLKISLLNEKACSDLVMNYDVKKYKLITQNDCC